MIEQLSILAPIEEALCAEARFRVGDVVTGTIRFSYGLRSFVGVVAGVDVGLGRARYRNQEDDTYYSIRPFRWTAHYAFPNEAGSLRVPECRLTLRERTISHL